MDVDLSATMILNEQEESTQFILLFSLIKSTQG